MKGQRKKRNGVFWDLENGGRVPHSNDCVTLSKLSSLSVCFLLFNPRRELCVPNGGNWLVAKGEDKYSLIVLKCLPPPSLAGGEWRMGLIGEEGMSEHGREV